MIMPARGCGHSRVAGGIYCVSNLSPTGKPIEFFLQDPPLVVNPRDFGLSAVGVKLIERQGVYHIWDWVGSKFYPNVADFVEEVRRFGLSRRISNAVSFRKLTMKSRIILLHSRAYIDNYQDYKRKGECPKTPHVHTLECDEMCARLWWEDVRVPNHFSHMDQQEVVRVMPGFQYLGLTSPKDIVPNYKLAIFGSFPIHGLEVINDPCDNKHKLSLDLAQSSQLPVQLVDE